MDGNRVIFNEHLDEARPLLIKAMNVFYNTDTSVREEMIKDYEAFITELVSLENEVRD